MSSRMSVPTNVADGCSQPSSSSALAGSVITGPAWSSRAAKSSSDTNDVSSSWVNAAPSGTVNVKTSRSGPASDPTVDPMTEFVPIATVTEVGAAGSVDRSPSVPSSQMVTAAADCANAAATSPASAIVRKRDIAGLPYSDFRRLAFGVNAEAGSMPDYVKIGRAS